MMVRASLMRNNYGKNQIIGRLEENQRQCTGENRTPGKERTPGKPHPNQSGDGNLRHCGRQQSHHDLLSGQPGEKRH